MIGTTLSHYKIIAKLGEGGMGEVYLAQDTKLKRRVALKVLPTAMASNPRRLERFQREAESVAALNHPNIVHIYSVDEADGVHFLTMELVEGRSLADLIPPEGLALDDLFDIAVPLADALSAAHEKGITHRDLKPANIMVADADKRVKILDFGLAKLSPFDEDDLDATSVQTLAMTQEGVIVGTVPYMSPEQLEAMPVDRRSDLFSFGIVLYEMATGSLPFGGNSTAGLISSILTHTPEPVSELRRGLPRHLSRIVSRCLEKDPRERYQTSRDIYNELKGLRQEIEAEVELAAPPTGIPAGGEALDEVPPATQKKPRAPARVWVITTLVLIGVVIGLYSWRTLSRPESVTPPAATEDALQQAESLPADAYQATVEARTLLDHYYRERNVDRAIRLFEHALALDAGNAAAYAGLAEAYVWNNMSDPDSLWLDRALESARAATELADQMALPHLALGVVLRERGDVESALEELRLALELDPLSSAAQRELGVTLADAGDTEAALAAYDKALELDPDDWLTYQRRGQLEYRLTRFDAAEMSFQRALELAPDYVSAHRNLAAVFHMQGRFEEAAAELQRSLEIEPTDRAYSNLGTLQFYLGRYAAAAEAFEKAVELGANNYPYWGNLGDAYRWAPGQRSKAAAAYQRALELGEEQLEKTPDDAELRAELALYRVKSGDVERALTEIDTALHSTDSDPWVLAMGAVVYEVAGRREEALELLGQTIAAGYSIEELKRDPELIELRQDPRYHRMMSRLNP